jgi:predicted AAA+ superfamily ATPase
MEYYKRIIDDVIEEKMKVTGAVVIKGPKWCGKTTSAKQFSKSVLDLQNEKTRKRNKAIAENDISLLLEGEKPRLIDEWQVIPDIWNMVKTDVDIQNKEGLYILTGSTTPTDDETLHSGIGRMSFIEMKPMSLYESHDSNGSISLNDIVAGEAEVRGQSCDINYKRLAFLVCRGGWPSTMGKDDDVALNIAKEYVNALCQSDISSVDGTMRNPALARTILKSYARNVSTINANKTMYEDVIYNYGDVSESTIIKYLNVLKRLFVIDEVESWNPNIRSKTSIRTSNKKGFTDPSIATAVLNCSPNDLMYDPETFGLLFENLVNRDLSVYVSKIGGYIRHYRDRYGLECDHVVHFDNGKFGLIETKLSSRGITTGIEKLRELRDLINEKNEKKKVIKEPDFLMVITGEGTAFTTNDGIIVVPLGCLKD